MDYEQSNTKGGPIVVTSADDLSELNARLVKLTDGGSSAKAALPTSVTDLALFAVVDGGGADEESNIMPLSPHHQMRVKAKGTGNAGDVLALADPLAAADKGKVRALPGTAGIYFSPGVAEEDFVDGQFVLIRPLPRLVGVKSADTLSALTFTAGGATGTEVGALRDAILAIARAQGLVAAS